MAIQPVSHEEPFWLQVARRELGVHETPGANSTARILEYRKYTKQRPWSGDDGPGSAWCSDFACYCTETAGVRSTRSAAASSWLTWGQPWRAEPGAIVVFGPHDKDAGGTGHVAFLVGVDGADVLILGGNQHNAVTIARRPKASVLDYRWPLV